MEQCQQTQELISRLLDDQLSAGERAELTRHLDGCPECRRLYEAFQAVSLSLKNDLEEPPEALHENVMAEIRREQLRRRNRRPLRAALSVAAVAALVLGIRLASGGATIREAVQTAPMAASLQMAADSAEAASDNGAVSDSAERSAQAQPHGKAAAPESANAETVYAAADTAEETALFSAAAGADAVLTLDFSDTLNLAALLARLDGEAVRQEPSLGEPVCRLLAADGGLTLYDYQGDVYFYAPGDGMPMRAKGGLQAVLEGGAG